MHAAAFAGHEAVVQLLCGAGANQNLPTMNGEAPMHIAAARGHEAIVQLLRHGSANRDALASLAMRFKVSLSQCICLYLNACCADFHSRDMTGTLLEHSHIDCLPLAAFLVVFWLSCTIGVS